MELYLDSRPAVRASSPQHILCVAGEHPGAGNWGWSWVMGMLLLSFQTSMGTVLLILKVLFLGSNWPLSP